MVLTPQHHNKGKVKVRNNFKKIKFSIFRKSVILTVKVGIADFFWDEQRSHCMGKGVSCVILQRKECF